MSKVYLTGQDLTIEKLHNYVHKKENYHFDIDPNSLEKMKASRKYVLEVSKKGDAVYGINTGFGALATKQISTDQLEQLQVNLIRSHATGVGRFFSKDVTRAIMLIRANCLISGFSGVNPEIVKLLLEFLNHDIFPCIPQKGSVGASGDLAPLAHLALALIGEGDVIFEDKIVRSDFVLDQLGLKPAVLGAKDGLALINGTSVMNAMGALAVWEAVNLVKLADSICATTLEGIKGTSKAYDERIARLKPQPGQLKVSKNLNSILEGSEILTSHTDCNKVQDPYSLRCVPQVHGAIRQCVEHAKNVLELELNSVTDNPLIFADEDLSLSGGNFHGEAIALAMDYLSMGLSELSNISERRVEKMMNPTFSELPAFLIADSGLNSGYMIAHVTAAALVSESKTLCHPASVDSIPTSTDKEDHVSMGITAGRKLLEILENTKNCLSIELLCACQAIDFQRPLKSSKAIEAIHSLVRKHVTHLDQDRILHTDMNSVRSLMDSGELLSSVENSIGELL